jgi:hypothetical protein
MGTGKIKNAVPAWNQASGPHLRGVIPAISPHRLNQAA